MEVRSRIAGATGLRHKDGIRRVGSLLSPGEREELIRKGDDGRRLIQSDVIICVKSFLNEALCGMLFPAPVSRDSRERSRGRPGSHNAGHRRTLGWSLGRG